MNGIEPLTGHPVVDAIAKLEVEGNVTPPSWFQHICYENKRGRYADLLAINILADAVYWYKPYLVRDEYTGEPIGWRKKFKGGDLQRSYSAYAEQFTASVEQVKSAFDLLEGLGLAHRDFRTVDTPSGRLGNVMYVGLNPKEILRITYKIAKSHPQSKADPLRVNSPIGGSAPPGQFTDRGVSNNPEGVVISPAGMGEKPDTYTEITTKTSTETSTNISCSTAIADRTTETQEVSSSKPDSPPVNPKPAKPKAQPQFSEEDFERLWAVYPRKQGKKAARDRLFKTKDKDLTIEILIEKIQVQVKQYLELRQIEARNDKKAEAEYAANPFKYFPMMSTWLNRGQWDDESPKPEEATFSTNTLSDNYDWSQDPRYLEWLQLLADPNLGRSDFYGMASTPHEKQERMRFARKAFEDGWVDEFEQQLRSAA